MEAILPLSEEEITPSVPQFVPSALIVDDNQFNRDVCRRALDFVRYRTMEASSGEEALRLLDELHFDMLLLDLQMPRVSGYDVLSAVRANPANKDTLIIVMTAHSPQVADETKVEADRVMFKPIDIASFATFATQYRNMLKNKQGRGDKDTKLS